MKKAQSSADRSRNDAPEILTKIDLATPQNIEGYLNDARSSPKVCVVGLAGKASEYLAAKASLVNVVISRELPSVVGEMEETEIDRYLLELQQREQEEGEGRMTEGREGPVTVH